LPAADRRKDPAQDRLCRFLGANQGLVVAEIELTSEDQQFDKPDWMGEEVTHDPRYYNSSLVRKPFSSW
jgi:CYTH domain-containing protein